MKVKIKRAEKARSVRAPDFRHPLDVRERRAGLGITAGVLGLLILLVAITPGHLRAAAGVVMWALLCFVAFGPAGDSVELKEHAPARPADAQERAWSVRLMDQLGRIEGKMPRRTSGRIKVSSVAGSIQTIGRTILVPARLRESLSDQEVSLLLAREVGHMRAGHPRLLGLVRRMAVAKPLVRVGGFPAFILALVLRRWMHYAEFTADRFALALFPDLRLFSQAVLKQAISSESDPSLTMKEVEQHLARTDLSHPMEEELATHFKLGEFMRERADLFLRLREAASFIRSDKFKELAGGMKPQGAP
jgi:Zn-dependent protease with chaperone function